MVTGNKIPTIDQNKTFQQALKVMNEKNLGCVVVTKKNKISSIITDGDLRRALNKTSTNKKLYQVAKDNPFVVNENMPASKTLAIMAEKKITNLLVVSEKDFLKKNRLLKGIIHIHFLIQKGIDQ